MLTPVAFFCLLSSSSDLGTIADIDTVFVSFFKDIQNSIILFLCSNEGVNIYYSSSPGITSQPGFTCSKLAIETLKQGVKYIQS